MLKDRITKKHVRAELMRRELERRKINSNPFYFVENYIWIENKDDTSYTNKVLFKMWPAQKQAWREIEKHNKIIIPKARQIGITWEALAYSLRKSLQIQGYKTLVLSQSLDYAQDAVARVEFMLEHLPNWYCQKKTPTNVLTKNIYLFEATTKKIKIWHPLKEREPRQYSEISARPSTKSAARSLTADLIIFDEWAYHEAASEVFAAAYPVINNPSGNSKFIGISTNQRGSFFEKIIEEHKSRKFHLIFIPWHADPKRTKKWYEDTKLTLPDSWMQEYPETVEQCMSAGARTALPEFSQSIHVCKPFEIPKHWPRWMGADNGHDDPFAWYKFAVNEDGTVFVYWEYTRQKKDANTRVGYSDQALHVNRATSWKEWDDDEGKDVVKHEKIQYIAIGRDAWSTHHRDESGKNLLSFYQEHLSYAFIKPVTDRKLRLATYHHYLKPYEITLRDKDGNAKVFKTAKLQIFNTCTELIRTLPLLVKDENDNEKVEDDSRIDNQYDAVGYGLITHHRKDSKAAPETMTRQDKYKRKLATRNSRKRGVLN